MGENSAIPWTHHSFNPWWGCTQISPACANCYAKTFANRFGKWFGDNPRRRFGKKHWDEPRKWNAAAEKAGVRKRVFCASMGDVFEDRRELDTLRTCLFTLIIDTPNLDWLLLTKRPEIAKDWLGEAPWYDGIKPEPNIWLGVTAENQEEAERRIPILLETPAAVRFVSIEPILGPVPLDDGASSWLSCNGVAREGNDGHCCESEHVTGDHFHGIDWVIVGDESGHRRRPAELDWVRSIRDQCAEAEVPFFFKQWHDEHGKHETPELDGVRHMEFPR